MKYFWILIRPSLWIFCAPETGSIVDRLWFRVAPQRGYFGGASFGAWDGLDLSGKYFVFSGRYFVLFGRIGRILCVFFRRGWWRTLRLFWWGILCFSIGYFVFFSTRVVGHFVCVFLWDTLRSSGGYFVLLSRAGCGVLCIFLWDTLCFLVGSFVLLGAPSWRLAPCALGPPDGRPGSAERAPLAAPGPLSAQPSLFCPAVPGPPVFPGYHVALSSRFPRTALFLVVFDRVRARRASVARWDAPPFGGWSFWKGARLSWNMSIASWYMESRFLKVRTAIWTTATAFPFASAGPKAEPGGPTRQGLPPTHNQFHSAHKEWGSNCFPTCF